METQPPIRLAAAADRAGVERVVHDAYVHYIDRIGKTPGPMLDDYADYIARGYVNVVEQGGEIVAVLVLIPEAEAMLLDNIAVSPRLQKSGFGRLLLEHAEARARALGLKAIRLYTQEKMTENIALYTRIGYRETHRKQEKGLDRVFMTKAL